MRGIGLRSNKSDASGEIWIVAPESRINGPACKERAVQEFVFKEDAKNASVHTSFWLSCQFTEAE